MAEWDPTKPVPDDTGGGHTHSIRSVEVSAALAGPDNDIPEGEWRVLFKMVAGSDVPAGHALGYPMTVAKALELAAALTQAAGDIAAERV